MKKKAFLLTALAALAVLLIFGCASNPLTGKSTMAAYGVGTQLGGGGTPEFLNTHPSHATRIRQIEGWTPEAKQKAAEFGVRF
jgi:Zn-dependent protease with chaperone function